MMMEGDIKSRGKKIRNVIVYKNMLHSVLKKNKKKAKKIKENKDLKIYIEKVLSSPEKGLFKVFELLESDLSKICKENPKVKKSLSSVKSSIRKLKKFESNFKKNHEREQNVLTKIINDYESNRDLISIMGDCFGKVLSLEPIYETHKHVHPPLLTFPFKTSTKMPRTSAKTRTWAVNNVDILE